MWMTFLLRRSHSHRSAVHVHLPVPNLIEPSPSQGIICRLHHIRDRKVERIRTLRQRVRTHIPRICRRTTAFDRLDDFEHRFFVWGGIFCQSDLAGAAAVGGLTYEGDGLGSVDGHDVPLCDGVAVRALFAGPVGAGGLERVGVEGCGAVGDWLLEFDVGGCEVGNEEDEGCRGEGFGVHLTLKGCKSYRTTGELQGCRG